MHALPAVLLASIAFVDLVDGLHCNTTYTWYSWVSGLLLSSKIYLTLLRPPTLIP